MYSSLHCISGAESIDIAVEVFIESVLLFDHRPALCAPGVARAIQQVIAQIASPAFAACLHLFVAFATYHVAICRNGYTTQAAFHMAQITIPYVAIGHLSRTPRAKYTFHDGGDGNQMTLREEKDARRHFRGASCKHTKPKLHIHSVCAAFVSAALFRGLQLCAVFAHENAVVHAHVLEKDALIAPGALQQFACIAILANVEAVRITRAVAAEVGRATHFARVLKASHLMGALGRGRHLAVDKQRGRGRGYRQRRVGAPHHKPAATGVIRARACPTRGRTARSARWP